MGNSHQRKGGKVGENPPLSRNCEKKVKDGGYEVNKENN
jgi:hypothetical protein